MDRSFRQKIKTKNLDFNHTLDQMDLTDIHRTFYSTAAGYTFFSRARGTFYRKDHRLGP